MDLPKADTSRIKVVDKRNKFHIPESIPDRIKRIYKQIKEDLNNKKPIRDFKGNTYETLEDYINDRPSESKDNDNE